jgi:hypothetical protein
MLKRFLLKERQTKDLLKCRWFVLFFSSPASLSHTEAGWELPLSVLVMGTGLFFAGVFLGLLIERCLAV